MGILVTGGAGFIGSNFIRYALRNRPDWYVTNLDKLTYAGNLENLRDVEGDPRYSFIKGDISDRELVDVLFSENHFDVVVNFAAELHVDWSILDPTPFIDTNIKGTQVLLEASREHGISKFVHVSTDEVYRSLGPADLPFMEESPLRPNSPYAASKAAADMMVRAYYGTYGLPAIMTRCLNNYGPYQFPEKLIPLMIANALEDKPLPDIWRRAKHKGLDSRGRPLCGHRSGSPTGNARGFYNIGSNCEMKNLDLVRAVLKVLGKPEYLITFVPDRLGTTDDMRLML